MMELGAHAPSALEWRQESMKRRFYELKGGDSTYGTLRFMTAFGSLAEAESSEGKWTFKRRGFFSPNIGARRTGSEEDVLVYTPKWTGMKGEIRTTQGERLAFHSEGFWGQQWVLASVAGRPLIRFENHGVLRHSSNVTLEPGARERSDLALLAGFCWYILLLHMEDASVTVTT